MDIDSYLIDLYPWEQEKVEEYIKEKEDYLDDVLEELYNNLGAEESVATLSEIVISEALQLQP